MKHVKLLLALIVVLLAGLAVSEMAMAQGKKKSTSKIPVKTESRNDKPAAKSTPKPKQEKKPAAKPKQEKKREADEAPRKVVERKPQPKPEPKPEPKDDAMFNINDVTKTVQAGNYKVMLLKDGSVVSYNRATGKNSKIHGGGAKDIGFYDTANGIISIRNTDDTRKRVNLGSGQIVNPEAAQPKAEPALSNRTFTANGVSFTMVEVQGGTFTMGATSEQGGDAYDNERPTHQVTLSSYYIGETEVTQELWEAVMGSNPSHFKGSNRPVEQVSWNYCQEFITKLNTMTGKCFRLPSEAEWEYAARGGSRSRGYKYSGSDNIYDVAWFEKNSNNESHPVATKLPNELGLYDMSGNVSEWCSDSYGSYSSSSQTNPTGPKSGSYRVGRGSSWDCSAEHCRLSLRTGDLPVISFNDCGLRLALSIQ